MSKKSMLGVMAILGAARATEYMSPGRVPYSDCSSGGNTTVDQSNATGKKKKYSKSTKLTKRQREMKLRDGGK